MPTTKILYRQSPLEAKPSSQGLQDTGGNESPIKYVYPLDLYKGEEGKCTVMILACSNEDLGTPQKLGYDQRDTIR